MERNWGTLIEAADRRGVSTQTMRRYITQGLVYAERVGPKLIRVDLNSVDGFGISVGGAGHPVE